MFSEAEIKKAGDDISATLIDCRASVHDVVLNAINAFRDDFRVTADDLSLLDKLDDHLTDLAEVLKQRRFREMVNMNAAEVAARPAAFRGPDPLPEPIPAPPPSPPATFEKWNRQAPAPLPTMPSGGAPATFAGVFAEPPDGAAPVDDADADVDRAVARNLGDTSNDPDFAAAAAAFGDRVAPEMVVEDTKVDPDFAHLHSEMARRTTEKA